MVIKKGYLSCDILFIPKNKCLFTKALFSYIKAVALFVRGLCRETGWGIRFHGTIIRLQLLSGNIS